MPKSADLLSYRLEMIEKRLDMLEQMLYTRGATNNGSGSQDVVALLMNIIKDNVLARPQHHVDTHSIAATANAANAATVVTAAVAPGSCGTSTTDKDELALLGNTFGRRRTTT